MEHGGYLLSGSGNRSLEECPGLSSSTLIHIKQLPSLERFVRASLIASLVLSDGYYDDYSLSLSERCLP